MCEEKKRSEEKPILMGIYEIDLYLPRESKLSHRRVKNKMSKKERKAAMEKLLILIKNHEGDWKANRVIAELAIDQGLRRKTVEEYVNELLIAQRIMRKEEMLYIVE